MAWLTELWLLVFISTVFAVPAEDRQTGQHQRELANKLQKQVQDLQQNVGLLSQQLMMQQYYVEEQTRSSGDSGLKRMRIGSQGTKSYHSASHSDEWMLAAIHNHPEYDRMLGFGEMIAVLNGVEFRTRHNDYRLRMRQPVKRGLFKDVPFPDVPPEVTRVSDLDDQVVEMREWFKAWRDQDYSIRDYRPYFRPVLCYLEGTWTNSDQGSLQEPFLSERHHLDAVNWLNLANKIRFTSYSGSKDGLENLAYLPTTVISVINGTQPVLAQWNFAILCHPLSDDLPLSRLRIVDDLKTRLSRGGVTMKQYEASRTARYQVATFNTDKWLEGSSQWSLLDRMMEQIPGRDGYDGRINDTLFEDVVYPFRSGGSKDPLNVAYYHRWYKVEKSGALGRHARHRGFSDANLFVAQTTDPKVAGLSVEKCLGGTCTNWSQKWTYAIPLEIVYMTPLSKWNPYDIPHKGPAWTVEGKQVLIGPSGKRNGGHSLDKAFNGTNNNKFYHTPLKFFLDQKDIDPADTVRNVVYVLDSNETMKAVHPSGLWIHMPEIPGVGLLRQRYPIMPLHEAGSSVWKELDALKEIVFQPSKYKHMFDEQYSKWFQTVLPGLPTSRPQPARTTTRTTDPSPSGPQIFITQESSAEWGAHKHHFTLSEEKLEALGNGGLVNVVTDKVNGHSHDINLYKVDSTYLMGQCDCHISCHDGHARRVFPVRPAE